MERTCTKDGLGTNHPIKVYHGPKVRTTDRTKKISDHRTHSDRYSYLVQSAQRAYHTHSKSITFLNPYSKLPVKGFKCKSTHE